METRWPRLSALLATVLDRVTRRRRAKASRRPEPATPEQWRAYVESRDPAWFVHDPPDEAGGRPASVPPDTGADAPVAAHTPTRRAASDAPEPPPQPTPPRPPARREPRRPMVAAESPAVPSAAPSTARPSPEPRRRVAQHPGTLPKRAPAKSAPASAQSEVAPGTPRRAHPRAPDPPPAAIAVSAPTGAPRPRPALPDTGPVRPSHPDTLQPATDGSPGPPRPTPRTATPAPDPAVRLTPHAPDIPPRPSTGSAGAPPAELAEPIRPAAPNGADTADPPASRTLPVDERPVAADTDPWPDLPPRAPTPNPGIAARAWAETADALRAEQRGA